MLERIKFWKEERAIRKKENGVRNSFDLISRLSPARCLLH